MGVRRQLEAEQHEAEHPKFRMHDPGRAKRKVCEPAVALNKSAEGRSIILDV